MGGLFVSTSSVYVRQDAEETHAVCVVFDLGGQTLKLAMR